MPQFLGRLLAPLRSASRLAYDAVATTRKRRATSSILRSEDDELPAGQRRALVATTRDLRRNFAIAAWAIRKHVSYVATFNFQSQTENDELNRDLENFVAAWSRPGRFHARYGRSRYLKIAEACRTLDGDFFHQKTSAGLVAGIEGDRIRDPVGAGNWDPDEWTQGIQLRGDVPIGYALHVRRPGGALVYDRTLAARYILPHGYYDRIDQFRGVSPIAAALNTYADTYTALELAMVKAKVSQLFALVLKTNKAEEMGIHSMTETVDADGDGEADHEKYAVDFGAGPVKLEMDPDEEAQFLESNTPSTQFQEFCHLAVNIALKSLDIPTCWFFEDLTNYSGQRQAWLLYEDSANDKREDNREILDNLTDWRLRLAVLDGELTLPAGLTVDQLRWSWISRGVPWLQPLQEVKADEAALANRITSRQRICRRRGDDFWEILDELEAEEAQIAARLPTPAPPAAVPPETPSP